MTNTLLGFILAFIACDIVCMYMESPCGNDVVCFGLCPFKDVGASRLSFFAKANEDDKLVLSQLRVLLLTASQPVNGLEDRVTLACTAPFKHGQTEC